MRNRLNRAVTAGIGLEIDRPVFGKVDLAASPMRPQELAGVIAPRDCHRIEAEGLEPVDGGAEAGLDEIPGVGVNGLVAHSSQFPVRSALRAGPAVLQSAEDHADTIAALIA